MDESRKKSLCCNEYRYEKSDAMNARYGKFDIYAAVPT